MKLRLTVPLGEGETATSFTSRLAAANGLKAAEFCRDWDLRFQAVVDGDQAAIATIAEMGSVDPIELLRNAFVRRSSFAFEHRGQRLNRAGLRRAKVLICPQCALDDIARHPDMKAHLAVYGRGEWLIDAIKTCPDHDVVLVDITADSIAGRYHDFAHQIQPTIPALVNLVANAVSRRASGLERYVIARTEGTCGSSFLDRFELHAAIKTCEVFGAVALFGTHVNLRNLPDLHVASALSRGFQIVQGGAAGIAHFLDGLVAALGPRQRKDGPGAAFGSIHDWLTSNRFDPVYRPLRDVVRNHVLENFPLVANTRLFGELISRQTRHSIHTLSVQTGQHPKTLRKRFLAAGLIDRDQMALSDHNVTFDAVEGSLAAREAMALLYLPAARSYLNATRIQADILLQQGFVKPKIVGRYVGAYDQYATEDLDAFMAKLRDGAVPVANPSRGMANIPDAARRACCSAADIVLLIIEKKLAWIGVHGCERGYLSVLVNVDEVKAAVRGSDHGGLTIVEVRKKLQANHRVVLSLIEEGYLATFSAPNTVNRCMQTLVKKVEMKKFMETYVSLHMLSKERKAQLGALRKQTRRCEHSAGI